jgi:hypothetical protein
MYKFSVSPSFAKQMMSILRILCYSSMLDIWTVGNLTTAKFKPFIFSVFGVVLPYTANMFILMMYDFCLLPAQLCYIILYIQRVETCVQIADGCAPWKISSGVENLVL